MAVEIRRYINTSKEDLESKDRNIFIGVSLGNKFFSKDNLREYILWSLANTKDDVLVLIADENQAINYEVLNRYSQARASAVALRRGGEKKQEIEELILQLKQSDQARVHIVTWNTVRANNSYQKNIGAVLQEFETNPEFQKYVLTIIDENIGERTESLSLEEKKKLAGYVLDELPSLLNGVEYQGKLYNLHPYPGLSSFDYLIEGLASRRLFPELVEKIHFDGKPAIVEAFVK